MRIAEVRAVPLGASGCSGNPDEKCGNGLEKIYPTTAVRYGYLKLIGEFSYKPGMRFTCGGKVVIQTDRGIEIGTQVSLTCSGCSKAISKDQMRSYAELSGEGYYNLKSGRILREATMDDLQEERHIHEKAVEKLKTCKQKVREHNLPMKVIECEHLFGGERVIFYFMSDARVDFRELVKDLAKEYHTRIEMRQIGARDEARLVADYETCGQECCCKTFLKTLKPITMRMAKLQKATLDPSKVSGRCGRLKCCLRYEHDTYEDLDKQLPRIGEFVKTGHGDGIVVDRQVLTQLLQIELDDRRRVTVVREDVTEVSRHRPKPEQKDDQAQDAKQPESSRETSNQSQEEKPEQPRKRRRRRRRNSKQQPSERDNTTDNG